MNTVPIISPNAPAPVPPVPSAASSGFSDLLASNLASGAALPLTPPLGIDPTSAQPSTPAPAKDTTDTNSNGTATVAIPLSLPHQQTTSNASNGGDGSSNGSGASSQGGTPAQPAATPGAAGGAGTGPGAAANGQGANNTPLPPGAAQLNARIASGAQSLISQPISNLGALAHGAQTVPVVAGTVCAPCASAPRLEIGCEMRLCAPEAMRAFSCAAPGGNGVLFAPWPLAAAPGPVPAPPAAPGVAAGCAGVPPCDDAPLPLEDPSPPLLAFEVVCWCGSDRGIATVAVPLLLVSVVSFAGAGVLGCALVGSMPSGGVRGSAAPEARLLARRSENPELAAEGTGGTGAGAFGLMIGTVFMRTPGGRSDHHRQIPCQHR